VLSGDPTRLPSEQILTLRAVHVFVAGRAMHQPPRCPTPAPSSLRSSPGFH
jgi:hypothetical protein